MAAYPKVLIHRDLVPILAPDEHFAEKEGFALLVACSGQEAWELIQRQQPNLAFIDIDQEELPGDECCRRVNSDPRLRAIPVVLIVPSGNQDALNRCLKARCSDILFKPLTRHLLLSSARRILGLTYRSFPRVEVRLTARYGSDPNRMQEGPISNLGPGGMFIHSASKLAVDQPLFVEFSLPNTTDLIRCQACVSWINSAENPLNPRLPTGFGLQFLSLRLPDLMALCNHIRQQNPAQAQEGTDPTVRRGRG